MVDPQVLSWERTYATFVHLSWLGGLMIGLPAAGPLVMWLIKKNDSPFVDDHGREATNFQISMLIYFVGALLLSMVGIGIPLVPVIWVFTVIASIIGAVNAHRGRYFRYPVCIRLLA